MKSKKISSKLSDLDGKTFGKLKVIGTVLSKTLGHRVWECVCECGNITEVPSTSLTMGRVVSCGCVRNENAKSINRTHGESTTPLWKRWSSMRMRCRHNKKYYVDRGITVCKEWEDFDNFKKDMEESFLLHSEINGVENTTLERKNSNKGYYLENCRWATFAEQNQNTRTPYKITNYKKLKAFLEELSKLKNMELFITEEEFLTLSYDIRKKIYRK